MDKVIEDNFNLLLLVSVAGTTLAVLASVVYRAIRGGHPTIPESEVVFSEKWASGRSKKNMLTKLGGASNCLTVTVGCTALAVRPMFPFNLMFLPEVYDLEHYIPKSKIKRVQPRDGDGRGVIEITYNSDGGEKTILLYLKKSQEFLRAVGA